MKGMQKLRVAIIGSDTLRGREIQTVLNDKKFPLKTVEFYDPDVQEEYSKLGQFGNEPKVVHHLAPDYLEGLDLVFLAADNKTCARYGRLAAEKNYQAVDLSESLNSQPDIPLVVAGVNDSIIRVKKASIVANPNPVTIILTHLLTAVEQSYGLKRVVSLALEPVSAFDEKGIQELIDQSYALLSSAAMPKKVFRGQVAFNLISHFGKLDSNGYSLREKQILAEIHRVMGEVKFPLSLSLILAPVFHTYSIMTFFETDKDVSLDSLKECFASREFFEVKTDDRDEIVSSATVAGKDKIHIGLMKKEVFPSKGYWVWAVADNLTVGSALNAYNIARAMFAIS